jgi:hypothetical protein
MLIRTSAEADVSGRCTASSYPQNDPFCASPLGCTQWSLAVQIRRLRSLYGCVNLAAVLGSERVAPDLSGASAVARHSTPDITVRRGTGTGIMDA